MSAFAKDALELLEAHGRKVLFVANHSGGKDSQAMLIRLLATVPHEQLVVVHASLGEMEWPGAMDLAAKQAAAAGVPFVVARAAHSLLDMVARRYRTRPGVPSWPSPSTRQCTSDLKRGPISREVRRYAAAHGFDVIVNCMGLRSAESAGRAKRAKFRCLPSQSNWLRQWYEWLPIHEMSTAQVFAVIADDGQHPHPAYALGNDRLSCVFCIMGSPRDIANGARHHPGLFQKYADMEQATGYTMHASRAPLRVLAERGL